MGRPLIVGHATAERKQSMVNDNIADLGSAWSSDKISGIVERQNILHNGDFRNPVNQLGRLEYSGSGVYAIDRWAVLGAGLLTVNNGFITVSASGYAHCASHRIP